MLELPYFSDAKIYDGNDLASPDRHLKVHYVLAYPGALDDYLAKAAASLRGKLPEEFRQSVKFSRFALTSLENA